jgi:hypothetical protein
MRTNDRPTRVRAAGTGFAVEGKGFYVWDEDPQVVMDSADELERGNVTGAHARRVLLIPVQGFGSSEALDV